MMPKAKADSVVTHRIELQETERALLEGFVIGKTVNNVLAPVATVLAAAAGPLVAWYLAQWTADEFKEFLDNQVESVRDVYAEPAVQKYNELLAVFQMYSWGSFSVEANFNAMSAASREVLDVENPVWQGWLTNLENMRVRFLNNFVNLNGQNQQNIDEAMQQGWTVADAFVEFYPATELTNDIIYERKTGGVLSLLVTMVDFFRSPFA
jgi:hypothetical protein